MHTHKKKKKKKRKRNCGGTGLSVLIVLMRCAEPDKAKNLVARSALCTSRRGKPNQNNNKKGDA